MKYLGSKNRISKYISPILQQYINENRITTYYEPFVGGANIIDKIDCSLRIGNDIHPQLIAMFLALQNGWNPPEHITEEEYQKINDSTTIKFTFDNLQATMISSTMYYKADAIHLVDVKQK